MALNGSTLDITYNAVVKTLNRVDHSKPYTTIYFLQEANIDYTVEVTHTIPTSRGNGQESHMMKLTVTSYSATDGSIENREVVWGVLKTLSGYVQDATTLKYAWDALITGMSSANVDDMIERQS